MRAGREVDAVPALDKGVTAIVDLPRRQLHQLVVTVAPVGSPADGKMLEGLTRVEKRLRAVPWVGRIGIRVCETTPGRSN